MKIKLCIPSTDIKHLTKALRLLNERLEHKNDMRGITVEVKNHIVEEGGYTFRFELDKGYNHDTGKLDLLGKLEITIDTTPKE